MVLSRRWAFRGGMSMVALALAGAMLGSGGLRVSRAEGEAKADPNRGIVRHITVFAVLASPDGKAVDSKLADIQPHLKRILPGYGFKLLDAKTARIKAGESIESTLTHGYAVETTLVRPIDEDGKVDLRCELTLDGDRQFAATVRAPLNQLFFCERPYLSDGSKVLIGVAAREF